MRERFVIVDGALVPWAQVAAVRRARAAEMQSHLAAPMVIRDALDGVVNPCDGKPYDSKRAYYQTVKDHGCVIVGNEAEKYMDSTVFTGGGFREERRLVNSADNARPNVTGDEIYDAYQKVEAGYKPAPLELDE